MIKIDKGIPVPSSGGGRKAKYPFRDMEIGDSFFVCDGRVPRNIQQTVVAIALKHHPKRFTTRCENKGVRVWRIE